jgi:hypothetical protein
MDNELVHVLCGIRESEAGDTIAAAFRGAKGDVEKGCIGGGEDREVVRHLAVRQLFRVQCDIGKRSEFVVVDSWRDVSRVIR